MMRVHGMKVICLTTGDLTDVWKRSCEIRLKKIYCEKSAEIIVPDDYDKIREGSNLKK